MLRALLFSRCRRSHRKFRWLGLAAWGAVAAAAGASAAEEPAAPGEGVDLEELLVITATLHEQSVMDAPASITVITASDIAAHGYRSLAEILANVIGFNEVSDTNEEIVGTRGVFASTTNKTLFLINGHRMNDLLLGRYNVDQYLGMEAVERIELIRGPVAPLYGTGALVGVVNIITKRGRDIDGTQVKYQGGPWANEAGLTWGKLVGDYDLFSNFTFRDQRGQEIPQGADKDVVPVATEQKLPGKIYWRRYPENFSGIVDVRTDNSSLTVRGAHFRRVTPRTDKGSFYDYDIEPLIPSFTENDLYFDYTRSWTFGATGANKITVNPAFHYFSYFEQSFLNFGANREPMFGDRSGTQAEMNNYQLKLTCDRSFSDALTGTIGFDGLLASIYRADRFNILPPDNPMTIVLTPNGYAPPGHWLLAGLYAQTVYAPLSSLTFTAGARFDTFEGKAPAKLTPRLGVVYRPRDDWSLKLLYGESYLAPEYAHRLSSDPEFRGTPGLAPETFRGGDAIALYQGRRLNLTADGYLNKVDHLINKVGAMGDGHYANLGTIVYLGVDTSADVAVTAWLRLSAAYSLIRSTGDEVVGASLLVVAGDILNIPRHTVRYGARFDPWKGLTVSLGGRFTSATKTIDKVVAPSALSTIPSVFLLDGSVVYTWRRLTLQLVGTNLTDRYYERGGTVPRPLARNRLMVEASAAYHF
jgi:outer membrane receptor for ferrienterochelin and colicins